METTKTFTMAFKSLFTKTFANFTGSHMILASRLPMNIKTFVMKEYLGRSIAFAAENMGYEVELNDGTSLFFDKDGTFKKASHSPAPPSSLCA